MKEEEKYFGYTFDEVFEKAFHSMTKHIPEDQWYHFNNSLGMWIYSKAHLKHEMRKRRMLPYEMCEELASEWDKRNKSCDKIELSDKARNVIASLKLTADKNGNITLGSRTVKALSEIGAIQNYDHDLKGFNINTGGIK